VSIRGGTGSARSPIPAPRPPSPLIRNKQDKIGERSYRDRTAGPAFGYIRNGPDLFIRYVPHSMVRSRGLILEFGNESGLLPVFGGLEIAGGGAVSHVTPQVFSWRLPFLAVPDLV